MTQGKKPVAACAEAKKFAERMGYQWLENPDPALAFDLFIFKPEAACIVRVRQTRYRIDPDTIYEKLIPDDLREVRALPFPPWFPKEIWLAHPARAGVAAALRPSDRCFRDRMVGA